MRQTDLDFFIDGWKQRGNGWLWIQRGRDVPMPEIKEILEQ